MLKKNFNDMFNT